MKTPEPPTAEPHTPKAPANHKKDTDKMPYKEKPDWTLPALIVAVVVAVIYCGQMLLMKQSVDQSVKALRADQRPWLFAKGPTVFPLNGPDIPATIQISNIGKTVATHTVADVVGTVFNHDTKPAFDDYGRGLHTRVYMGAVYPGQPPMDVALKIVDYTGTRAGESGQPPMPIRPDQEFTRRFNNHEIFIVMFGAVRYCDVFGVEHWAKFCNGSGEAIGSEGIKECIDYNQADSNDEPQKGCASMAPRN